MTLCSLWLLAALVDGWRLYSAFWTACTRFMLGRRVECAPVPVCIQHQLCLCTKWKADEAAQLPPALAAQPGREEYSH